VGQFLVGVTQPVTGSLRGFVFGALGWQGRGQPFGASPRGQDLGDKFLQGVSGGGLGPDECTRIHLIHCTPSPEAVGWGSVRRARGARGSCRPLTTLVEMNKYPGELAQSDRDTLLSTSYAALMPGAWPEPFGLVAIEALACATPVIARRIGALPEMVRDGIDGWFGDDVTAKAFRVDRVASLDRAAIRRSVLERFSAEAMATAYEDVYRRAAKVVPLVQRDREAAAVRDEAVATALGGGA